MIVIGLLTSLIPRKQKVPDPLFARNYFVLAEEMSIKLVYYVWLYTIYEFMN